jgi:ATP synthase protein I
MNEMSVHLNRFTKLLIFFLLICLLVWLLFPDYRIYAAGLIVGSFVSYINTYYLSLKIKQLTQAVVNKSSKRINLGFLTRASIAVLAMMWALVSDNIHVGTMLGGLLFTPLAIVMLGIQYTVQRNNK